MNRLHLFGIVTAIILGVVVPCAGQPPEEGVRPRSDQGEQGTSQTENNRTARRDDATFNFEVIRQNPWFSSRDLQIHLQFEPNQLQRLNENWSRMWGQYNRAAEDLDKNLTPQQRSERLRQLQLTFRDDFSRSINDIIADPRQQQRFSQLQLQFQGPGAFDDLIVQRRLQLTDQQRQLLVQLQEDWRQEMSKFDRKSRQGENARKRFMALRQQASNRIAEILTEEQRRMWAEMLGESYEFSPTFYFTDGADAPLQAQQ